MAGGGDVAESDLYALMMTAGAAERVAHYRQEAEKFRQLAQAEPYQTRMVALNSDAVAWSIGYAGQPKPAQGMAASSASHYTRLWRILRDAEIG
jgi:hypothetical protein